jgi:hypothetical protein
LSQVRWFEDKESRKTLVRPAFEELQRDIFGGQLKRLWSGNWTAFRDDYAMASTYWAIGARRGSVSLSLPSRLISMGPSGGWWQAFCLAWRRSNWNTAASDKRLASTLPKNVAFTVAGSRGLQSYPARAADLKKRGLNAREIAAAMGVSERTAFRYLMSSP